MQLDPCFRLPQMCSASGWYCLKQLNLDALLPLLCSCTGPILRLALQTLPEEFQLSTAFLAWAIQTSPIDLYKQIIQIKPISAYFSKFFSFLLSSSRCLNFISLFSSASIFWFDPPALPPELLAAACCYDAPPSLLFILVESTSPSGRTAAKRTFLILFNSVVNVTNASLELLSSYWHLCFSTMLFSTCLRVRFVNDGEFIRTPISNYS